MSKVLIKYVRANDGNINPKTGRREKGHPIGVVTAHLSNDDIHYGWSLVNEKAGDRWNRQYGLDLAVARGEPLSQIAIDALSHKIPQSVSRELTNMVYRAKSYFHQV